MLVLSDELKVVAAGLFLVGAVVVLVAIIGCVAAGRENRYLLLLVSGPSAPLWFWFWSMTLTEGSAALSPQFGGFIIVLILGQLFISVVLLINRNRVWTSLTLISASIFIYLFIHSTLMMKCQ